MKQIFNCEYWREEAIRDRIEDFAREADILERSDVVYHVRWNTLDNAQAFITGLWYAGVIDQKQFNALAIIFRDYSL